MSIAFFRNILCHADLYYTSKNGGNNLHVYFFIEAQNCLSVGKNLISSVFMKLSQVCHINDR